MELVCEYENGERENDISIDIFNLKIGSRSTQKQTAAYFEDSGTHPHPQACPVTHPCHILPRVESLLRNYKIRTKTTFWSREHEGTGTDTDTGDKYDM